MHEVIENGLEDFLSGNAARDFNAHLKNCRDCQIEVTRFSEVSGWMAVLKPPSPETDALQPHPSFYARLSQTLEASKAAASPWTSFSITAAFGRRLAFGSLMTLALLGGFLLSRESDFTAVQPDGAEAVMAAHDGTAAHEFGADRDRMMATLASYER